MIDNDEREKLKALILKRIEITKEQIGEYEEMTKPISPDSAIGRISRIDAIQEKSIADVGLIKAKEKLHNLEYALSIINTENYGKCVTCGSELPIERLRVLPESLKCLKCLR